MTGQAVRAEIVRCLDHFRPVDIVGHGKLRLGRQWDGGYVLVDDLDPVSAVYSFGVGPDISFELDLAARGKHVLAHDPYVSSLPPDAPRLRAFAEGLGPVDDPANRLHTLGHFLRRNGDARDSDMILKIDVEGAEYDALAAMGADILGNFRQLAIEFHNLLRLADAGFRDRFLRAVEPLHELFAVSHVHANNCAPVALVHGFPCADVLEVSYVRRDTYATCPSRTVYPTIHDRPNDFRMADHLLWFFPFLAGPGTSTAFEASLHAARVQIGAELVPAL